LITVDNLGSTRFKEDYRVRAAYVAGAMVKGIASAALVTRMARAGRLSFYGSGGMRLSETEAAIREIQAALRNGEPYGVNVLANASRPQEEMETVDLLLRLGVHNAEASAFMQVSPAIVKFRLKGVDTDSKGRVIAPNRVIAKLSRTEVAEAFLLPAPQPMIDRLLAEGHVTAHEAALAPRLPVATDLCVEADSGGHTDMGAMSVLLPAIIRLRDSIQEQRAYQDKVHVGAAGGIGSPEAAASAFLLGADFILTGSINQCTVEAGTSDAVKDMLQGIGVRDTAYAPAGDMFEMGSKIQVMKKGVFFPARASKLYDLWRTHSALEQIDAATRSEVQDKYYRRSFEDAYLETKQFYMAEFPAEIERAERNPKAKMALIFRWYFVHTMRLALEGTRDRHVDYQVHTGPAIGAFNQWVAGTPLEDWRKRHVDTIADHLMQSCADYMNRRLGSFVR
jgi:trans-AT polyketide synthase/acyltransferase/oxidoreductase domain-containing protein